MVIIWSLIYFISVLKGEPDIVFFLQLTCLDVRNNFDIGGHPIQIKGLDFFMLQNLIVQFTTICIV